MTPSQIAALRAIRDALNALTNDSEVSHVKADHLLCAALMACGPEAGEVAKAFDAAAARVRFWYS